MHVGQGCLLGSVQGFTSRLELSMIQTLRSWKDNNVLAAGFTTVAKAHCLKNHGSGAMHFVGPSSRLESLRCLQLLLVEPRKQALRIGKGP